MSRQFCLRTVSAVLGIAMGIAQGQTRPGAASTPGEFKESAAREAIAKYPKNASGYNDLAIAFIGRARESANPSFYDEAEGSLKTAMRRRSGQFRDAESGSPGAPGKGEFEAARV